MKHSLCKRLVFVVAVLAFAAWTLEAEAGYRIGVLAKRGERKALSQWVPTAEYLNRQLSEQFTVVPLKFTEIEPAVMSGNIEFVLANSAFYAEMNKKHGVRAVATLINSRKGHALDRFGGVVFVRRDRRIHTLSDVRGKSFMCVKFSSFGGAHMAWRLLLDNGIDPKKDCRSFVEGNTHDNVVMAVLNGLVEVGTVRSDTLERMQDEGKIALSDFRVIHRMDDDFPFVHSTQLYPEWPLAACRGTDPELARRVAGALTAMPANSQALKAAKIVGWSAPADYGPVVDCLRRIRYGAFAAE